MAGKCIVLGLVCIRVYSLHYYSIDIFKLNGCFGLATFDVLDKVKKIS